MRSGALDVANLAVLDDLYARWMSDPASVTPDWQAYFAGLDNGAPPDAAATPAPLAPPGSAGKDPSYKQGRVHSLLWAYRDVGYLYANLNPLRGYLTPGLKALRETISGGYETLTVEAFGLEAADLDTVFTGSPHLTPSRGPLRDIVAALQETYSSAMGVEFLHIQNKTIRTWLIENLEANNNRPTLTDGQKRTIQQDLIQAEEFERFIHSHFVGQKRFSVEGSEALLPALHYLINVAAHAARIEEIVIGMSHRGRLNVLANLMGKSIASIFATFDSDESRFPFTGSGDVRYHLGYSADHRHADGSEIHISLVPNPSHLEAVDPVVQGKARGTQRRRGDETRRKVIPVLLHGDAAFTGQGVVAETLNMSQLRGYKTGGTIHIVVNNQIGFTTAAADARSTFFPTDAAKAISVPVFHVNGDRPEYVIRAMDLAIRFRQEFGCDAVVDIFCYRKYGHNESDDPTFTHPLMYETIRHLPSAATQYAEKLDREGVFPEDEQRRYREAYRKGLMRAAVMAQTEPPLSPSDGFLGGEWKAFRQEYDHTPVKTGVPVAKLKRLGEALCTVPDDIKINPKLKRIINGRRKLLAEGAAIDWATAEALSFASLLAEGIPVRLSGEDSGRGTFSQRHAIWWDIAGAEPVAYTALNKLGVRQARFAAYDSPLSEFSVLGFEYGNAMAQPNMLTIWEAQFGDFCNGAQVVIDQFVTSGEVKWNRSNGLVMLLPHGYSGQGPDHSTGHLERFLQMCADDNIQVCNMTTPAQYFHVLRRQMLRPFRKPLIIMAPKSLLRHKGCVSSLRELAAGSFREVLDDPAPPPRVDTLLLCSGQVYYDLLERREHLDDCRAAILRVEQLHPFPEQQLAALLKPHAGVTDIRWVQEEPRNRGAWTFMREHAGHVLDTDALRYVGRPASANSATGSFRQHLSERQALLDEAFARKHALRKAV